MLLDYLSTNLILTNEFISNIANTANERYNKFSVSKKNGGTRVVYQPQKELKLLQRILHDDFLGRIKLHPACTAYCQGASVLKNASIHKSRRFLLRLDFVDFFKSITSNDILACLNEHKGQLSGNWTDEDLGLLLKIVCYKGRLTMGSVTSPVISNFVCSKLDFKLHDLCASLGVTYSRYADDMYFSTDTSNVLFSIPGQLIKLLRTLEYPKGLILNTAKTKHSSKKRRMSITGLIITNDGNVSLGRDKKREIRSLVFKWHSLTVEQKKYLQGYLSYCASVEPLFINSLCVKFSSRVISDIQSYKP
ncbi:retron St85 family RNA-directed DNA polymerase [Serratia fonticola]